MKKPHFMKGIVVGIIALFICASFAPSIGGYSEEINKIEANVVDVCELQEDVLVTCRTFGFPGEPSQEITMSPSDAELLYDKIKVLQIEIACDPLSDKTQQLQHEIITLADEHDLLPAGLSAETLKSRLTPTLRSQHPRITLPRLQNRASEMFCNYVSTGSGTSFPIIILPRLIPILLTPIPRLFVRWSTLEGMTSCGGLRSGTGFIAYGAQNGIALGFWGIGFSIFLPPVMAYGLFGYALFASVTAEEIEFWPPNNSPVISNENPSSGTWNVPVSLSELSFQIEDADGDLMSYSVTTDPDIGSGSGNNKKDGVYTVPISGLEHDKTYSWTVEVTDGKDTTMKQFSFITEAKPPFDPFDEGWQYRKEIRIYHAQVAGDLVNFPVLVSTVDSDLRDKTQDDGDDILFMADTGVATKLYHEIEHYDGSTGEFVAWVNIPSVSDDEDTVLYMYYGNPGCSSQQFPEKTWDSNYCGVWHLNDFDDSTINDNFGTNHGTVSNSGIIGNAKDFEKTEQDYIELVDMPEPADNSITTGTFEAWLKPEEFCSATIICKSDNNYEPDRRSYAFHLYEIGTFQFGAAPGTWYPGERTITATTDDSHVTPGIWQQIAGTADLSTRIIKLYYNGEEKESATVIKGDPPEYFYDIDLNEWFGVQRGEGAFNYYDGILDEVRISKIIRSAEWISTQYNNQNDPSSFLSFGPEETGP